MGDMRLDQLYTRDGMLRGCYVYILLCDNRGDVFMKIGHSSDPFRRVQDIRIGCPLEFDAMFVLRLSSRGLAMKVESRLHQRFSHKNLHGEWFSVKKSEKAEVNKILGEVLAEASKKSMPLKFEKINVRQLIADGEQRRLAWLGRTSRRGRAYLRLETRVVSPRVSRSRFSFSFFESPIVTKIGIP